MSEWSNVNLASLLSFGNGKSRPLDSGNIPVYGGNGIMSYVSQCNYDQKTIIIGRVGAYCGATYYENKPIWISDNALSAKAIGKNDTKYLYYLLKNLNLNQFAEGSSHPLLTQKLLNSIETKAALSPNEQKSIASVLSSLDDKIDLLHRQNKTLESMAETLFRQWFIEEAQEDWEDCNITDLFEVRDGTHASPKQSVSGYPLVTSKHIGSGIIDFNNTYLISEEDYSSINKRSKVEKFDILFSMIGTIGSTHIELSDKINYAIKNVGLLKTSQNHDWKFYTYLWLLSSEGKDFIHATKSGSTQEYISLGSLRSIVFNKPDNNTLRKFNNIAEIHFNKIYKNNKQIITLEKLRDTLLPKLMSGEVQVQYAEEAIASVA
ncbi:restriction endonuclease subunit S [Serratia plymuthica]|uniref:restriction endonuclease subunit S n=1 Tax=Serratia plymuthica TaxID=82996 RepID=UPI0014197561|nr:restriction endonuclease subunit S [Serratia plymuthica]NIC26319.1 restriction endonuclease subunit S [Serratia plymuthica]